MNFIVGGKIKFFSKYIMLEIIIFLEVNFYGSLVINWIYNIVILFNNY